MLSDDLLSQTQATNQFYNDIFGIIDDVLAEAANNLNRGLMKRV
jgi:hypothetical protein